MAELKIKVEKLIVHPNFNKPTTLNNDIALLYLAEGDISRLNDIRAKRLVGIHARK